MPCLVNRSIWSVTIEALPDETILNLGRRRAPWPGCCHGLYLGVKCVSTSKFHEAAAEATLAINNFRITFG